MSNTFFMKMFNSKTKEMIMAGLNHVNMTIALYNGDYPALEEQKALDFVLKVIEEEKDNDEVVMQVTCYANQFGMEFAECMQYAIARHAFNVLMNSKDESLTQVQ